RVRFMLVTRPCSAICRSSSCRAAGGVASTLSGSTRDMVDLQSDGEFLDAVVLGIGDVEAALAVEDQAVRGVEPARGITGPKVQRAAEELAARRKQLHPVVGRADPDAAL